MGEDGPVLDFLLVFVGLIVVSGVIYGLATFVFGRGEELAPMPPDVAPMLLPEHRRLTGADVRDVRLPVTVRGYRMGEVDELLDRVAEELDRVGSPLRTEWATPRAVGDPADEPPPAAGRHAVDDTVVEAWERPRGESTGPGGSP